MSVDIATLGIKVDSTEVKRADGDLDRLADTGKKAKASTETVTSAFNSLKGALAVLGIGTVARELGIMADSYKNVQGRLGLVTSGTAELAIVSDKLFASAQRTRTGFEATVDLYGALARSTKVLGTSQTDLLQVTETINQALVVSGASASTAEGALRQLSQGFASGTLRGDELNSVLEGTPRLAQAIADGMGVTVGKLRSLGAEGKITGETVFNALKSQKDTIEREFATMPTTIGQSFVQLRNQLLKFVGEADSASGASSAFAAGVQTLAKNLDAAAVVVEVLVVAFGIKLVGSFVASTAAAITQQAALVGLTTTAEVTGFAIGVLASRLAALSILGAVAFAIVGFANETSKASAAVADANRSFDEMKKRLDTAGSGATTAAGHVGGLGKDALGSIPKIDAFGGRIGAAAQELYNMARAARSARVEMLETELATSQQKEMQLSSQTVTGRAMTRADNRAAVARGDLLGVSFSPVVGSVSSFLSNGRTDRDAAAAYGKQIQVSLDLMQRLKDARNASTISADDIPGGNMPTATGGGTGKGGGGGKSATQSEYEQQLKSSQDYVAQLKIETAEIGLNEIELHRMAAAREAAKAPTEALRDAILAQSEAWTVATMRQQASEGIASAVAQMMDEQRRATEESQKAGKEWADQLEFENSLLGMSNEQRATSIARRDLETKGIKEGTVAWILYSDAILKAAGSKGALEDQAQQLSNVADHMRAVNDNVRAATSSFADLFGTAGAGFASLIETLGDYAESSVAAEARIAEARSRYGADSLEAQRVQAEVSEQAASRELETYGRVIRGVKGMFKEKSTAYKVMEGIEKTYAAVRLAMAVKEILTEGLITTAKVGGAGARMATDAAETASSVSKSGIRAAADGVAAIAKAIASLPFPLNIAAGAATAAALVAFGVKLFGGGGGSPASAALNDNEPAKPYDYATKDSPYSVLQTQPGYGGDSGGSRLSVGNGGGQSTLLRGGDTYAPVYQINAPNADDTTVERIHAVLAEHQEITIEKARRAAQQDRVNGYGRQQIGGVN